MGAPDPAPVVTKVYRAKGHVPFPLPDGYTVVGLDESGCYPPNQREAGQRFRRMIIYAAVSGNPIDGLAFKDGTTRAVYGRQHVYVVPARSLWTELNGVHSEVPELRENSLITRMLITARLITQAGYDGTPRTKAVVDRFWPEQSDELFHEMLGDFGVYPRPETLIIEPHSDTRVPVVREAHIESRRLWSSSEQQRRRADSRVDIPPQALQEKMSQLEKRHPGHINALHEREFYEGSRHWRIGKPSAI